MKHALLLCAGLACVTAGRAGAHGARPPGELTANWPTANSSEAVHLVHGDYDARPGGELKGEARERASPEVFPVHGEYDWIRLGNYRNQSGEACCGRDDCSVVARERIRAGADGFVLLGRGLSIKRSEALPSEDGKFWLCAHPDGRVRCFFVPPEM